MMTLGWWYERMDNLAIALDCSVTSARRTPSRNKFVGGATNSQHLSGQAWDLVPDDMSPTRKEFVAAKYRQAGFYALVESDHVHVHIPRPAQVGGEV